MPITGAVFSASPVKLNVLAHQHGKSRSQQKVFEWYTFAGMHDKSASVPLLLCPRSNLIGSTTGSLFDRLVLEEIA